MNSRNLPYKNCQKKFHKNFALVFRKSLPCAHDCTKFVSKNNHTRYSQGIEPIVISMSRYASLLETSTTPPREQIRPALELAGQQCFRDPPAHTSCRPGAQPLAARRAQPRARIRACCGCRGRLHAGGHDRFTPSAPGGASGSAGMVASKPRRTMTAHLKTEEISTCPPRTTIRF